MSLEIILKMKNDIYSITYKSDLDVYETQKAIKFVKDRFENSLSKKLNLLRVTAPLFVLQNSGLNDGLSGKEKPISFNSNLTGENIEIVHSLAKWKRMALRKYDIHLGKGLYTDMNAIRKDEVTDFIHSIYVDQWDWELSISEENRTYRYLKSIVKKIYSCIYKLSIEVEKKYSSLKNSLPKYITFVSTKELERMYPNLSRKEREDAICREHKAVFLYQIGCPLKDKKPHDDRAADYDDWKLNGDIILFDDEVDAPIELSSMGIRVDKDSLVKQLTYKDELDKLNNPYCKSILNNEMPFTVGGGIGQSRLCMYYLKKKHIGEVQSSYWPEKMKKKLLKEGIEIL